MMNSIETVDTDQSNDKTAKSKSTVNSKILKYKKELDATFYLNYFENIANLYHWNDAKKYSNFLSSIGDSILQNEIMKIYYIGFTEIKNVFLDEKQLNQ